MAVRRYDEEILNRLLDKYEGSLLYTGKNRRNQTIAVSVTRRTLPDYFDEASLQYEAIHAQLLELEQKGLVRLVWKGKKQGHILEKCVLCPERAAQAYAFVHRRSREEKENRLLAVCRELAGLHPVTDRLLSWVETRVRQGGSLYPYADASAPEELAARCRLICAILKNREEVFLREFSVRFYRDSKLAEREIAGAVAALVHFSDEADLQGLTAEQVLEEFRIYKNPSWVMMKGCGRFALGGQEIALSAFPGGIGISSRDIADVRWTFAERPARIVTIENLTSFHRFEERNTLAVYLGGYHSRAKREFLKGLYAACGNETVYLHFGDIDCGGFRIWKDLRLKTGIPFMPYRMDLAAWRKYAEYGKPLTEHDKKELLHMAEDPFFAGQRELFAVMLREGKKLEQECMF